MIISVCNISGGRRDVHGPQRDRAGRAAALPRDQERAAHAGPALVTHQTDNTKPLRLALKC